MKTSNGVNTILSAIEQICQEKKLSKEQVLEAIEQALASAYRKDFGHKFQNIKINFDPETGQMKVFDEKTVVEDLPEPSSTPSPTKTLKDKKATRDKDETKKKDKLKKEENLSSETLVKNERRFNLKTEIQLSEARQNSAWQNLSEQAKNTKKTKIKIGDVVRQELEITGDFGRIAAQTAKQVIIQRLREAERETIFEKYKAEERKIINGIIQRRERQTVFVDLGETTAILPYNEQVQEEIYRPEQKIKVYLVSVNKTSKGPEIIVSRRHPNILRELFKLEIPEIANEVVEIKAISREPGSRSKVAVWTKEKSIDPIGAAIGQRGVRIQTIIAEIGGEKIDIIEYDDDPEKFIANALSPAKISSLKLNKKEKSAIVRIDKNQLSLAIGRGGQNVRLAAKLTGWRIDVQEQTSEDLVKAKKAEEKKEKEEEGPKKKKTIKKKTIKKKTIKKTVKKTSAKGGSASGGETKKEKTNKKS